MHGDDAKPVKARKARDGACRNCSNYPATGPDGLDDVCRAILRQREQGR